MDWVRREKVAKTGKEKKKKFISCYNFSNQNSQLLYHRVPFYNRSSTVVILIKNNVVVLKKIKIFLRWWYYWLLYGK
jgi:hypothetical protein